MFSFKKYLLINLETHVLCIPHIVKAVWKETQISEISKCPLTKKKRKEKWTGAKQICISHAFNGAVNL